MAKRIDLGAWRHLLLFGLFYCMENNKAVSLTRAIRINLTTARSLGQAFVEVAKKVQPAVVNITTEKTVTLKPGKDSRGLFQGEPL